MPHRRYHFLSLLPVLLFASTADATTRRVPSELPTIQAGINAAVVGDTVLVAPGSYTGSGNFNIDFDGKDIVLISESGPEVTIIDAQGGPMPMNDRRVFFLSSGETDAARIDGFTISGGRSYTTGRLGGGILCISASPTIANCIIRQNWAGEEDPYKQEDAVACGRGGGLFISAPPTPMRIVDCVIAENGANCDVGAVFIDNSSDVTFERCVIVQNRGIGVYIASSGNFTFTNCTIAYTSGFDTIGWGLITSGSPSVFLERSVVWGNCFGVWIANTASVQSVCSVIDSSKVGGGGAITYVGQNIFTDPRFCSPRWCPLPPLGDLGDYRVTSVSPCLPENNSCGVLIGALGSCAATSVPVPHFPDDAIWASPNPFSTSTSLSLGSALDHDATLTVFDIAGRRVRELRMMRSAVPVTWDGADENGKRVAPGIYVLRLEGGPGVAGRVTVVR